MNIDVAHFGNLANDAYPIIFYLRKAGIDGYLYVEKESHVTELPQWELVNLRAEDIGDPYHPNWEKLNENFHAPEWLRYLDSKKQNVVSRMLSMRSKMRKHDLIVAHVPYFIYAQFFGVPYLAFEAGEIRNYPGTSEFMKFGFYGRLRLRLKLRSYRHAKRVLLTNPDTIALAQELISNWTFMPFLIDTNRYKPTTSKNQLPYEHVVLCPSRQEWDIKGQHLLIKAFKRFTEQYRDSHLFLTRWGKDISKSIELIKKLNLTRHCTWLSLMSKPLVIDMFNKSTVVADQFILGSSGTLGLEAMACGKPLVIHLSEKHIAQVYHEAPPAFEASSEEQIYKALVELSDANTRRQIGQKSRNWIMKYHSPEAVIPLHLMMYEEALA